ncbi:MAG: hypothetical protein R6U57_13750 [Anaerolineales bacterium]
MINRETLGIGFLAAATLIFETTLTRFLGVAQYYHFAFLVVSLALLGLGASGTFLSLFPSLTNLDISPLLTWVGLGFSLSVALAYGGVNWIPFDSYSIAWERIQVLYFFLYYFVLSLPFLISGLGVGVALSSEEGDHHQIYAANLVGSAVGVLLTPAALELSGVPGAVLVSVLCGLSTFFILGEDPIGGRFLRFLVRLSLLAGVFLFAALSFVNLRGSSPLGMTISPYKGLSHARRYPGSTSQFGAWNAISRVDVLSEAGTHTLPGLSYQFKGTPPDQLGMSIDGGPLHPLTQATPDAFPAADWMPESLAFSLVPQAHVLVLKSEGGLGVLQALAGGAKTVTVVEENPLLLKASAQTNPKYNTYHHPHVQVEVKNDRAYLQEGKGTFDLIYYPLTDAYRPVTSGAFSLAEDYTLTVEGFGDALQNIEPGGVLVVTRWLQSPPSEGVRLVATLLEAGEKAGLMDMGENMVIYRGVQTLTVLVKPAGWSDVELRKSRAFLESRRFDLVWASDVKTSEVNRFNQLPEPLYYQEVKGLLGAQNRDLYLSDHPFDISPPDDNHPFFFHYFTWGQTPQVFAALGRTWQPFGGSGYFVLLALLGLVLILSAVLILLPLFFSPRLVRQLRQMRGWPILLYFALLGMGFMLVEIPLIQRWMLFLGHPISSFAVVVGTLLFFSGWGSMASRRKWELGLVGWGLLILCALGMPLFGSVFKERVLSWPLWGRVGAAVMGLAPLGFLMGFPFPTGLTWIKSKLPGIAPWAWAVNGFTSVIASVIASILALSWGYWVVFISGLGAYILAGITFWSLPD